MSRDDLSSGVMKGKNFLKHLPFNKVASEQQEDLRNMIKLWLIKPDEWIFTNTEDWFDGVFSNTKESGFGLL